MAPTLSNEAIVYIGRFNPHHLGHCHVMMQALKRAKLLIVLIGSTGLSRSLKNPFTFDERRTMIQNWYDGLPNKHELGMLVIKASRDFPYNDTLWQRSVQKLVKETGVSKLSIKLIGSDRDESTWYLQAFPQWPTWMIKPYRQNGDLNVNATDVRKWLFESNDELSHIPDVLPLSTLDFLENFKETDAYDSLVTTYQFVKAYKLRAEAYPYPPIYQTVDSVVIQSGHVLTVERGHQPGKGLWALPGGFVNPDEKLRDAAIRETIEETNLTLAIGPSAVKITKNILRGSIRAHEVFDKPDRSDRGRTITNAYYFRLDDTKPLPIVSGSDQGNHDPECDVTRCFWLPIDEALERSDMWFEDHHSIIETLIGTQDVKVVG